MFQITRRYAEFSAAIVGLNESYPSSTVQRLLGLLQNEVGSTVHLALCRFNVYFVIIRFVIIRFNGFPVANKYLLFSNFGLNDYFLMSSLCLYFNIPVSILSYLCIDLRSEVFVREVVFNLGASKIKVENVYPTFPTFYISVGKVLLLYLIVYLNVS